MTTSPPISDFTTNVAASWISADWNALIVGYKDSDGIGTKAQVSAVLRKVNRATLGEHYLTATYLLVS
jgi:hypothetical protein